MDDSKAPLIYGTPIRGQPFRKRERLCGIYSLEREDQSYGGIPEGQAKSESAAPGMQSIRIPP